MTSEFQKKKKNTAVHNKTTDINHCDPHGNMTSHSARDLIPDVNKLSGFFFTLSRNRLSIRGSFRAGAWG